MGHDWLHEIVFGTMLGNIAFLLGVIRYISSIYRKQKRFIEQFIEQHDKMYDEYADRQNVKNFNNRD